MIPDSYDFAFNKDQGERLDKYLVSCFPDLSRSRIQKMIELGCVLVDDLPVTKAGYKLEPGTRLQVTIPKPVQTGVVGEALDLSLIFENEDVLVYNKPAGVVVHPSVGHVHGTLVNAAIGHAPEMVGIGGEGRPGVVHRLDKDTSGIILMAKNDHTLAYLQDQFKKRTIEKVYIALVDRHPPTPEGRIEAPIGRDPTHRQRMAIVPKEKGREAVSLYKTVKNYKEHALLEVHPLTGRTHQIRVHLAFIGCPVAGDRVYGFRKSSIPVNRHFLHASRITICIPGEVTPRTFMAPLPSELEMVLDQLNK